MGHTRYHTLSGILTKRLVLEHKTPTPLHILDINVYPSPMLIRRRSRRGSKANGFAGRLSN